MSDRYVAYSPNFTTYYQILDCETDEFVEHEVENKYHVLETVPMRFTHKESAVYHADQLNAANA
jgi:hypothetical protein